MLVLLSIISSLGFLAFYLARSSKEMPKNWSQFRSEMLWQYLGVRGLIEDYILRKYNRVGKDKEWSRATNMCDYKFDEIHLENLNHRRSVRSDRTSSCDNGRKSWHRCRCRRKTITLQYIGGHGWVKHIQRDFQFFFFISNCVCVQRACIPRVILAIRYVCLRRKFYCFSFQCRTKIEYKPKWRRQKKNTKTFKIFIVTYNLKTIWNS